VIWKKNKGAACCDHFEEIELRKVFKTVWIKTNFPNESNLANILKTEVWRGPNFSSIWYVVRILWGAYMEQQGGSDVEHRWCWLNPHVGVAVGIFMFTLLTMMHVQQGSPKLLAGYLGPATGEEELGVHHVNITKSLLACNKGYEQCLFLFVLWYIGRRVGRNMARPELSWFLTIFFLWGGNPYCGSDHDSMITNLWV